MNEIKDVNGKVIAAITAADPNEDGCDEGLWLEVRADDGTRPTISLVKDKPDGPMKGAWYLGFYRNAKNTILGCDLTITFTKDGPVLQVIKNEELIIINLFDILAAKVCNE